MFRSALALGMAAAVVLALAVSPAADAAKGGKPRSNAVVPELSVAAGSQLYLGGSVSFDYVVSPTVDSPRIQVVCSQGGVIVYGEAAPAGQPFKLGGGSSTWLTNGGAASCVATLYSWDFHPTQTFVPYASLSFDAGGTP